MHMSLVCALLVALAELISCAKTSTRCPNGERPVQCFAQPCAVTKCAAHPNATCRDDYCGGCNARFYQLGKREVTSECRRSRPPRNPSKCPMVKCANAVQCFVDPCRGKTCPRRRNAVCCSNYCGGCNWRFHENGQDVTNKC